MDIDAIILSVIASVPEIIVIVGACVLLMIAPVRGRRFGPLLVAGDGHCRGRRHVRAGR